MEKLFVGTISPVLMLYAYKIW